MSDRALIGLLYGLSACLLSGGVLTALLWGPDKPWFALVILGIVAFTAGLTQKDALANETDHEAPP